MKRNKGFTIIELCVVIMLMTAIAVVLVPFIKETRRKACAVECLSNIQKIGLTLRSYALTHEGAAPKDLAVLWNEGYIDKESVFDCPLSGHKGTAKEPDYIYDPNSDFTKPENIPVFYDKPGNHRDKSVNVLYSNGDIEHQIDSTGAEK